MFIFGTISMYTTFSNVDSNTTLTGVDVAQTEVCDAAANQCLHLKGTNYMPFAYLTYKKNGYAAQNVVVPEFYANNDGIPTWYSAVPCLDFYVDVYGDDFYSDEWPLSLIYELVNEGEANPTPWLCPNITKDEMYILGHEPVLSHGSNFNFVVNACVFAGTLNST